MQKKRKEEVNDFPEKECDISDNPNSVVDDCDNTTRDSDKVVDMNEAVGGGVESNIDESEEEMKMIERVCIYHVPTSILSKLDKDVVQREIKLKFEAVGVSVKKFKFIGNKSYFESCVVEISPVDLRKIWGRRLGVTDCSCISY